MSGISLNNTYNTFVSSNINSSNYILNSSNNIISYANNIDINLSNYILNTSNIISNRFYNTSANVSNINTITDNSEAYLIYNFDDDPQNGVLANKSTFAQQNTSYPLHSTINNNVVISKGGGSNLGTTNGLVLWYKFDGNFNDSSGNNYHLTNSNASINTTSNIRGNGCAYFSGNNQYCTLPSTINFGATDEMTFCCWFRIDSNTGCSWERIFDFKKIYNTLGPAILLTRYGSGNTLMISVINGNTADSDDSQIISTFTYLNSYFYHIAIVFKKTGTTGLANNTWQVYINGSQVYSSSSRRFPNNDPTGYASSFLGKSNWATDGCTLLGYIDDFRYYNRELSLNEIKEIYGYSLTRQIGYVNPFNYYWNSYNLYDSAFINIPSEVLYPIIKSKKFSICYWNKLENIINDISILKLQQDNNLYVDIKLETHSTSNITKMIISNGSNLSSNVTTWGETNTNTNINAYNHYVHTFDYTGSTMYMKTYKNGIQQTAIGQLDGTSNITNFSFNPIKKQSDIKYPRQALTSNAYSYTDNGIKVQVGGSTYYDTDGWNYYKAFDHNKDSCWHSDITPNYTYSSSIPYGTALFTYRTGYPGEFIEIDLGEAIVLSYYILYPRDTLLNGAVYTSRLPSTFRIYASNNSSAWGSNNINHTSWILIDERIDYIPNIYTDLSNKFYIPNNNVAYRYYVMIINKIGGLKADIGSSCVGLGEWELYSSINNCCIGKQNNATNLVSSYMLEDFRIYDRVLTDNEITSIGNTSSEMYGMQKINSTINNIVSSQWTSGITGINYMGGNVGIGTINPSGKFDIANSIKILSSGTVQPYGLYNTVWKGQIFITDGDGINANSLSIGTRTNPNYSYIQGNKQWVADTALVLNPSGGNVGIGTTNPQYKLVVAGQIMTSGILIDDQSGTGKYWNIYSSPEENLIFLPSWNSSRVLYIEDDGATGWMPLVNMTGQHGTFTTNKDIMKNIENYIGYIACVSEEGYWNEKQLYSYENTKSYITINESLPLIELSKKQKDKRVIGVISNIRQEFNVSPAKWDKEYFNTRFKEKATIVNAIGEGAIWVANINGNIENGDYITSSDIPGIGMRQNDDLVHNYTVAKITMDCDFEPKFKPKMKTYLTSNVLIIGTSNISTLEASNISTVETSNMVEKKYYNIDSSNNYIYTELQDNNNNVYEYEYEMKYIRLNGTIIDKNVYDIELSSNLPVYKMAFVGCTYHCG